MLGGSHDELHSIPRAALCGGRAHGEKSVRGCYLLTNGRAMKALRYLLGVSWSADSQRER